MGEIIVQRTLKRKSSASFTLGLCLRIRFVFVKTCTYSTSDQNMSSQTLLTKLVSISSGSPMVSAPTYELGVVDRGFEPR